MKNKILNKVIIISTLSLLLIISCGNPLELISPGIIQRSKDEIAPEIEILSPESDEHFGQTVTVTGTIIEDGEISELSWQITGPLGILAEATLSNSELSDDGFFSFNFSTLNYSSDIVITVDVTDWNDNTSSKAVTLLYPGSEMSSFTVVPGNKLVQVYWENIPDVNTYNVYYTDNGNIPSSSFYKEKIVVTSPVTVDSPLILENLRNGYIHIFTVKAIDSEGNEYSSANISVIPMTESTFAPSIKGQKSRMKITWDQKSTNMGFEVWKSDNKNGTYTNISGTITGSIFYDTQVTADNLYFYRIKPTLPDSIISGVSSGKIFPLILKKEGLEEIFTKVAGGSSKDIELSNGYAYIACNDGGLKVIDVNASRGTYKDVIWEKNTTGDALAIDIAGDYAYIAEGPDGIEVFKIASSGSPISPILFSEYDTDGSAQDVKINPNNGNYLLVADGPNGLQIIDVSDKTDPVPEGVYQFDGQYIPSLSVETDYAYFPFIQYNQTNYVRRVNISSLTNAIYNKTYSLPDSDEITVTTALTSSYVLIGGYSTFTIMNKSGTELSNIKTSGAVTDIAVDGNRVYILEKNTVIRTIDISDSINPIELNVQLFNREINDIEIYNSNIICSLESGGLMTLGSVELTGTTVSGISLNTNALEAGNTIVSGNNLYIGNNGIRQFDLISGELSGGSSSLVWSKIVKDIDEQAGLIYGVQNKDIRIIDAANMTEIGSCTLPDYPLGLIVRGDYAYVGTTSKSLQILDISNPLAPFIAGFCTTLGLGKAGRLTLFDDDILYMTQETSGVAIIDVSDPLDPESKGYCPDMGGDKAYDVACMSDLLIVAVDRGVVVYDISDPDSPSKIDEYLVASEDHGSKVKTAGDYIFLLDSDGVDSTDNYLHIIDAADPSNLELIQKIAFNDPYSLAVTGNRVYLHDDNKLKIIDISLE